MSIVKTRRLHTLPGYSQVRAHTVAELLTLPWVRMLTLVAAWLQPSARLHPARGRYYF